MHFRVRLRIHHMVYEKGRRGAPLSETQRRHNRQKSKIRALVEHVFGFMENSMNGIFLWCIGLKRTEVLGLVHLLELTERQSGSIFLEDRPNRIALGTVKNCAAPFSPGEAILVARGDPLHEDHIFQLLFVEIRRKVEG